MTESRKKPKKFILRRLVVAALVMALAFALAMGANAATDGQLFERVITLVTYSEDGSEITMEVDTSELESASQDEPLYFTIEESENGKTKFYHSDKDGNFVSDGTELPDELQKDYDKIAEDRENGIEPEKRTVKTSMRPATEAEAASAIEAD